MTEPLNNEERARAELMFRRVFASADPYDQPLREEAPHRALLYPVAYELTEEEFEAVMKSVQAVGDEQYHMRLLEEAADSMYRLPVGDYDAYASIPINGHVALFGSEVLWGLIVSDAEHGVVGGPDVLVKTLRAHFPPVETYRPEGERAIRISFEGHAREFVAFCRKRAESGGRFPWLHTLLVHVYGDEEADELLRDFPREFLRERR